ncbi:alkane 1-monooxygenase [Galdieria sulphuraria]|uniref:Alkane 1-monooxygenase n=1 Tax=Galdieria sulphuraria TaxID=130081 RepID=M2VSP2_GALSU|nr:alkane 1-monooxygenase [Galdieria sulphuraria]EME26166.1 alkane 1-monooxygenase [Galdieria sulphuraria]|eukprot:XP_005702686.1 alkane 1-monooxygenase [Galdieria sulphuraria]
MYTVAYYYIAYSIPFSAHCSLFFHSGYGKWCSTLYVFVLVPILDLMFGKDYTNPSEEDEKFYKYNFQYTLPLLLWLPSELFLITKAAKYLNGDITFAYWLSSTIAVGLCSGIGIACAHELGHIPSRLCSFFSKGLLLSACYGSFAIEHNYGHHKNVGTDKDPTTAKLNESFYHFFFRSISGVVTNSWKTESKSLKRRGYSGISLFLRNQVLFDSIVSASTGFLFYFLLGWKAMVFYFTQALVAVTLLQLANYIEHYGLIRHKLPNGRYEPVNVSHSWDAPYKLTNLLTFKLQRHSDHHQDPLRPYHLLRMYKETPKLPYAYITMMVIALFPPYYFRLVHPLIPAKMHSNA